MLNETRDPVPCDVIVASAVPATKPPQPGFSAARSTVPVSLIAMHASAASPYVPLELTSRSHCAVSTLAFVMGAVVSNDQVMKFPVASSECAACTTSTSTVDAPPVASPVGSDTDPAAAWLVPPTTRPNPTKSATSPTALSLVQLFKLLS